MLSKLLKHEFRATGRILLPVYLVLFISAGLFNVFMHLSDNYDLRPLNILRGITAFVFFATVIGAAVLTLVLMVYRFYKNLMTDEGYLMFTLPVTTGQILRSKLLVALFWSLATTVADMLALLVASIDQEFLAELLPGLRDLWEILGIAPGHITGYIVETVVLMVLVELTSYLIFYAAIALGHSFSNHKILLSVVFYIGFTFALQVIGTFGGVYGIVGIENGTLPTLENMDPYVIPHIILLTFIVVAAIGFALFYTLTHLMLKKRLNLQ